jgi:hypothetical protein
MKCRITNNEMEPVFSLGELYVSNFIKNEDKTLPKADLTLELSKETQCLQLTKDVDSDLMYGKYWYRSGINDSMKLELKDIAEKSIKLSNSSKTSVKKIFVDVASNDGTLLSYVNEKSFYRLGIDPVEDSFHKQAIENSDETIQAYFSAKAYASAKVHTSTSIKKIKKADIVTCIAMFYDLTDPIGFSNEVKDIMKDDGLFVIQQSYMPLMIKQLAFDNICHEHIFYHSLFSMEKILNAAGLKVVDVELNDINGGSFRLYIQKENAPEISFGSKPFRDVAQMRLTSIRELEKTLALDDANTYKEFYKNIVQLKDETFDFIKEKNEEGKTVWVYGASTKGNTLLQWYGLTNKYIEGAAERSPFKYGLKTVGTNIPIYSEDIMRVENPDYLLILPWHFIDAFEKRESKYLENGGHFIVPCPKFKII